MIVKTSLKTLDQLPFNRPATIVKLTSEALSFRQRLLSMGMVPGAKIIVRRAAPLGDPIQIEMRGFNLCLRRSEASAIQVEEC